MTSPAPITMGWHRSGSLPLSPFSIHPAAAGRGTRWSIVNLVLHHLAEEGLHPVLGEAGDPGKPAADLLRALGIKPAAEGNRIEVDQRNQRLAEIRAAFEMSHVESP